MVCIALTHNILEGLGGVGVRARGAGHAPARACAHGWAVCPHSLDLETRRQASLLVRDRVRVPKRDVTQLAIIVYVGGGMEKGRGEAPEPR